VVRCSLGHARLNRSTYPRNSPSEIHSRRAGCEKGRCAGIEQTMRDHRAGRAFERLGEGKRHAECGDGPDQGCSAYLHRRNGVRASRCAFQPKAYAFEGQARLVPGEAATAEQLQRWAKRWQGGLRGHRRCCENAKFWSWRVALGYCAGSTRAVRWIPAVSSTDVSLAASHDAPCAWRDAQFSPYRTMFRRFRARSAARLRLYPADKPCRS